LHQSLDTLLAPLNNLLGLRDLHDPLMDLLDYRRTHRDPPTPHGLGVRDFLATDTREVAVHQIGTHLALQHLIAPIAQVFQDQQSQHDLGGESRPAATTTVRMALRQGLMNRSDDCRIREDRVDMRHPCLTQILDPCRDQAISEAAL